MNRRLYPLACVVAIAVSALTIIIRCRYTHDAVGNRIRVQVDTTSAAAAVSVCSEEKDTIIVTTIPVELTPIL